MNCGTHQQAKPQAITVNTIDRYTTAIQKNMPSSPHASSRHTHNKSTSKRCFIFFQPCTYIRVLSLMCAVLLLLQLFLARLVPFSSHQQLGLPPRALPHRLGSVKRQDPTNNDKNHHKQHNHNHRHNHHNYMPPRSSRCAINLWGLPRAFGALVLPSLERNVIQVNAKYKCDYFVHFYSLSEEVAGRSGGGGHIDPYEIYNLRETVLKYQPSSQVVFVSTTESGFWNHYQPLIDKIRNTVDSKGKHVYFPDNAKTYTFPTTTDNIIKMWHTIQESWTAMEHYEQQHNFTYHRVAMLRNDVVYMTPIDIYETQTFQYDTHNTIAVIPGFGRHPVSDRLIYGPRRAIQVWAAQRFQRLEDHVQWIQKHDPGWGLHSERFVNYTLFAAIRDLPVSIVEHDSICFFRARADASVWISDCDGAPSVTLPSIPQQLKEMGPSKKDVLEQILKRQCGQVFTKKKPYAQVVSCPRERVEEEAAAAYK